MLWGKLFAPLRNIWPRFAHSFSSAKQTSVGESCCFCWAHEHIVYRFTVTWRGSKKWVPYARYPLCELIFLKLKHSQFKVCLCQLCHQLSHLKFFFFFCSYILNSSSMVKASTLTFDLKPLSDSIDEVSDKPANRAAFGFVLLDVLYHFQLDKELLCKENPDRKDRCCWQKSKQHLFWKNNNSFLFSLQLRQQFEVRLDQMSRIKSRLANRSVTSELEK